MDSGREFVENAVKYPQNIWISDKDANARIYFAREPIAGFLFAVVVDIVEGVVLTAHIVRKEKGLSREWPL